MTEPESNTVLDGTLAKRSADLAIAEVQQPPLSIHHGHTRAEQRKARRAFQCDRAATDNNHRLGNASERQSFVAVKDRLAIKRNPVGSRRLRTNRQQNLVAVQMPRIIIQGADFDFVQPQETC